MDGKSSNWRPGPSVCRCCLSDGCYKDIATEYFWMGKREVYEEMLVDTLGLTISFGDSNAQHSQSRLICETCISRLRNATDFKKQVKECEQTFLQYLNPSTLDVVEDVISLEKEEKQVTVKEEKSPDHGDDFNDNNDFLDDDNDDELDDQPLMNLATKVPKKESVDVFDLLDNAKPLVKRKSTTKAKTTSSKKAKIKETKTKPKEKPEKKKKGRETGVHMKEAVETVLNNVATLKFAAVDENLKQRIEGNARRAIFRKNLKTIMSSCTAYPFKYRKGKYQCFFCKDTFLEPEKLREHSQKLHSDLILKLRKYEPLKMDFAATVCKICGIFISNYAELKAHLKDHGKALDCSYGEIILPYKLSRDEHCCQICGKRYEMFLSLHKHMNYHYEHFICETCGKGFATIQRMVNHSKTHETGDFPCKHCGETLRSHAALYAHVAKVHKSNKRYKCPICDEKFASYKYRIKHLNNVHGEKTAIFPCPSCPKVFDLCSRRTAHIRSQHLQERNHACSTCGMKFFTNYELQEHSIKHGGARIYQCDVCKKSYARLKTLREHMRIHNNDRRFVCPVCGQTFIQKCSLKQHVRVHHPMQAKAESF
ncbi:zinc finger protein 559-like isoform X4 [Leptidea sinapis]|uniref:zinc finger protein 559-like isoform X4 n=1 Tax=Leptidea sinapis TaxID=189913 RepID=UPI0021C3650B|nr:zinc finger protein 559-like isoform X4 [Leptidea sinapis]